MTPADFFAFGAVALFAALFLALSEPTDGPPDTEF